MLTYISHTILNVCCALVDVEEHLDYGDKSMAKV